MAEAAPGQLRDRGAAGRDQRPEDQADLASYSAGGGLVDGGGFDGRQVQAVAGGDHRGAPGPQLGAVQTLEVDRHQQRGHLLVGDLALRVRLEQPADVVVAEPVPVPFGPDQRDRVRHRGSRRSARSVVVKAAGSRTFSSTGPSGPSTSRPAPPASSRSCRQRPHGSSGCPSPATTATATSEAPGAALAGPVPASGSVPGGAGPAPGAAGPAPCRALTRLHSAHRVRPKEAFSTLEPTMIRPSSVRPAAPTRSPE